MDNIRVKELKLSDKKGNVHILKLGDRVRVSTDNTDYNKSYTGSITELSEEGISIDDSGIIPFFNITKISNRQ